MHPLRRRQRLRPRVHDGGEGGEAIPVVTLVWQPCELCGALGVDADASAEAALLVCPQCGHEEQRVRRPFFSITGPSGSGKSTLLRRLWRLVPEVVAFDGDVLWHASFWNDRQAFYDRWLALAGQASQTARGVAVLTAAMPDDWRSDFAVLVGDVHMLALVCDEDELTARLASRERPLDDEAPPDFLEQTRSFDRWLRANVEDTVDTSKHDRDEAAALVAAWIRERL